MIAAPVWILSRPRVGTSYMYIYASARLDNNGKGVFAFSSPYAHHHCRGKQKYIHTVRRVYVYKKHIILYYICTDIRG
jgi:hypothetical protein